MKTDKHTELVCRTFLLRLLLVKAPADFPSLRELRIQEDKLRRRLDKRPSIAPAYVLGGGSLKKVHKERGRHDALCGQQSRLLMSMIVKSFQEYLRAQWAKEGKPYTRKAFKLGSRASILECPTIFAR